MTQISKKIILAAMLVTVLPALASAQETSVTTKPQTPKPSRQELINDHSGRLFLGLNNIVTKLDDINTRLTNWLDATTSTSTVIASAKTEAAAADKTLAEAKQTINDLETKLATIATSTTPGRAFQPLKTEFKNLITDLNQVRQKLLGVLKNLNIK